MRELIKKYPDMAKIVLDNCIVEKNNNQKTLKFYNCEFLEDTFKYRQEKDAFKHVRNWLKYLGIPFDVSRLS